MPIVTPTPDPLKWAEEKCEVVRSDQDIHIVSVTLARTDHLRAEGTRRMVKHVISVQRLGESFASCSKAQTMAYKRAVDAWEARFSPKTHKENSYPLEYSIRTEGPSQERVKEIIDALSKEPRSPLSSMSRQADKDTDEASE